MTESSPRASSLRAAAIADAAGYVDRWVALHQRLDRVPGVQIAVIHEDEVILSSAHGVADLTTQEPLTTDHRFRIASHSKTFTATAVHALAQQGSLRLDDRLAAHVAELDGAAIGSATVRELLGHGGGIVRDGWASDYWQLATEFPDAARLVEIATDHADVLSRNERFKYSNIGYSLLGLVIESVTGEPYAAHVQRHLLDPLGLTSTAPDLDPDDANATSSLATGHSALAFDGGRRLPIDHIGTAAMASATGFVSTASDVVRWAAAHFSGDERILDDDTKRVMQRTEWAVAGSAGGEYALGLAVTKVNDRRLLGHGGGFPGHITHTLFDPHDKFAVSVLTNAIDGPAQMYAANLFRLVDLALESVGDGDRRVSSATIAGERFTGRFANLWGVVDIAQLGGRLYQLDPSVGDPTADAVPLEVADVDTLRVVDAPGYGAPGERLVYHRRHDGSLGHVRAGGGTTLYPFDEFDAALQRIDRVCVGAPIVTPDS